LINKKLNIENGRDVHTLVFTMAREPI
jgi:hypothetical protein